MTSNAIIGAAGVYYVAMELSRRGMLALITSRNTPGYDIAAMDSKGKLHANIQVKASSKRVHFFPMPHPDKVCTGRRDFYVLVRWNKDQYEGFLLTGRVARAEVVRSMDYQKAARYTAIWPTINVGGKWADPKKTARWARAWTDWIIP